MIKPRIEIRKPGSSKHWKAVLIFEGIDKDVMNGQFMWEHPNKEVLERFKRAVEDGKLIKNPKVIISGGFFCEDSKEYIEEFKRVTFDTVLPLNFTNITSKYMAQILCAIGYVD